MSGAILGGSALAGIGFQALSASGVLPAFIRNTRSLGTIIPDVTIEEQHSDRMQVTQHPIASGSPITDHAYMLPATVTMRLGWTNANPVGAAVQGFMSGGLEGGAEGLLGAATEQRVKDVYAKLLKLQFDRTAEGGNAVVPFTLTTGKRSYKNMVIVELGVRTDHTTEYSLMLECHMQEVFIVDTQTTTQPAQPDQASPEKTQDVTPTADKQFGPPEAPATLLSKGIDWVKGFF